MISTMPQPQVDIVTINRNATDATKGSTAKLLRTQTIPNCITLNYYANIVANWILTSVLLRPKRVRLNCQLQSYLPQ